MSKKPKESEKTAPKRSDEERDMIACKMLISASGGAAFTLSEMFPQVKVGPELDHITGVIDTVRGDSLKAAESML